MLALILHQKRRQLSCQLLLCKISLMNMRNLHEKGDGTLLVKTYNNYLYKYVQVYTQKIRELIRYLFW